MGVNEQCVGSFLNSLEDYVDFSAFEDKNIFNQSDNTVMEEFYSFANKTIYASLSHKALEGLSLFFFITSLSVLAGFNPASHGLIGRICAS